MMLKLVYQLSSGLLMLPAVIIALVSQHTRITLKRREKNDDMEAYLQLLCFFLFISLRLQCTVVLLEDKMTKRHKFTIKERKTGDKLTGVSERERERVRERVRETEKEKEI